MIALDLVFTESDKVLATLEARKAHAPMPCPLPERLEVPAEPAEVVLRFVAHITPHQLPVRRLPIEALSLREARMLARAAARRLFPGRPFVASVRPA